MNMNELVAKTREQVDDLYDMITTPTHDMSVQFLQINETLDKLSKYCATAQVFYDWECMSDDIDDEQHNYLYEDDLDPHDPEKVQIIMNVFDNTHEPWKKTMEKMHEDIKKVRDM